MKYLILDNSNQRSLEHKIDNYLKDNWKLHGDLKVIYIPRNEIHGEQFMYVQAVIKV